MTTWNTPPPQDPLPRRRLAARLGIAAAVLAVVAVAFWAAWAASSHMKEVPPGPVATYSPAHLGGTP